MNVAAAHATPCVLRMRFLGNRLEQELNRKLHLARRAKGARDRAERGIAKLAVRVGEVDGVQHIVRLDPKLQTRFGVQLHVLEDRHIEPALRRPMQEIARHDRVADRVDPLRLERGVRGVDRTPFLLAALVQLTQGRSLRANVALLEENARVGAAVAVALAMDH